MSKTTKKRYYGTVKIKEGQKLCWLSKENKNGWSLGLGLNQRTVWLTGLRFKSRKEVERILESDSIPVVFVELKNSKDPIDQ